ncbi:hypothetical protein [Maribacter litoralis]
MQGKEHEKGCLPVLKETKKIIVKTYHLIYKGMRMLTATFNGVIDA